MTARVRRRHGPEGQERLVLDDLPAAARSSASTARRRSRWSPTRTASRASAASRTATTSTRAPPTWPTCTTPTATGAATGASSSARSRASCSASSSRRLDAEIVGGMALYIAVSIARLRARSTTFVKGIAAHDHERSSARSRSASSTGTPPTSASSPLTWPLRAAAIALAATWFVRTLRKEKPFLDAGRRAAPRRRAAGRAASALTAPRPRASGAPEVTFVPENKRVVAQAGPVAAGDRRGQRHADRGRLPDGHLRRRPGRDQGRDGAARRRSPTTRRPRSSGSAWRRTRAWRAACASPGRSRSRSRPTGPPRRSISQVADFNYDTRRQARRRDRQRDRGRDRRRPPAPPASR